MHSATQSSFFTYSVSRPYPSRWFTPVVISGGIVLAILFTFIAMASNAYELKPIYTTNPNTTESQEQWFEKSPFSWVSSLDTQCQTSVLTVGVLYQTANRGFTYTFSGIQTGVADTREILRAPSTTYKNTPLHDCEIVSIQITLARFDFTPLAPDWWTWGASTAAATIQCSLDSPSGRVYANFTGSLPPVGSGTDVGSTTAVEAPTGAGSVRNLLRYSDYQKASGNLNMCYGITYRGLV
nr:hypothetical protein B0A51_03052 [Rachicladosporium sp. CCFEE 5018]